MSDDVLHTVSSSAPNLYSPHLALDRNGAACFDTSGVLTYNSNFIGAFNGFMLDELRGWQYWGPGGGHSANNYEGNAILARNLGSNTIGPIIPIRHSTAYSPNQFQNQAGTTPAEGPGNTHFPIDGRPLSRHTYDHWFFIENGANSFLFSPFAGAISFRGGTSGIPAAFRLATNDYDINSTGWMHYPGALTNALIGICAKDPRTQFVWIAGVDGNIRHANPFEKATCFVDRGSLGGWGAAVGAGGDIDTERDLFVLGWSHNYTHGDNFGPPALMLYNMLTGGSSSLPLTGVSASHIVYGINFAPGVNGTLLHAQRLLHSDQPGHRGMRNSTLPVHHARG
jgi:hypothetical protein